MKIKYINNLQTIKTWISRILILACFIEVIVFPKWENAYGCLALLYGWMLIHVFVVKKKNLTNYLLPTIVVFGYGISYFFLPIVVTLLEAKPLTFNFEVPYLTFTNQIISVTVIVLAYLACTKVYQPRNLLNTFWNFTGYLKKPREIELWILGFIGLSALIYYFISMGDRVYVYEYSNTGNALSIIINVLSVFSLMPICIYFKKLYGDYSKPRTKPYVKYYIVVLMLVGIASTRRLLIFNAVVTIICIYFFLVLYENRQVLKRKYIFVVLFLFYLVTGPAADLAAAMAIVRQNNMGASSSFSEIIDLYSDKEKLHNLVQLGLSVTDNGGDNDVGWSEYYIDNIFLDRFCNLRTVDATMYNAQKMGFGCEEGRKYYKNFWINELPGPLVEYLGLKKDFYGTAVDHMVVESFGDKYSLFGNKVGGETGVGLWCFGYWYYVVAFMTYVIVFYFLCSIVNIRNGMLIISPPILIGFKLYWMFFINANGIFTSMSETFARGNLNKIAVYCILFFLLRLLRFKR